MTDEEIRRFLAKLNRENVPQVSKVEFPAFEFQQLTPVQTAIDFLEDVGVEVVAELGEVTMKIKDILEMQEGTVISLDRTAGDAIDLAINNQKFARGEVLVLNEAFAVRINSINLPSGFDFPKEEEEEAEDEE